MFRLTVAEVRSIFIIVAVMWLAFVADWFLPLEQLGLRPRHFSGLAGVVAMPFLHLGLGHLVGNTVPLCVLLGLLALSRDDIWPIVVSIVLLGGIALWVFGRNAIHLGASGLVFGLAVFLIVAGFRARSFAGVAIAAITIVLYGGTLLSGVLPFSPGISWDGHLSGALAGGLVALYVQVVPRPSEQ